MELAEQINILNDEIKQHLLTIDNVNAEKLALDQMYIISLKELLNVKKDNILKDVAINHLNIKLQSLTKERDELQHTVTCMASEAQSSG